MSQLFKSKQQEVIIDLDRYASTERIKTTCIALLTAFCLMLGMYCIGLRTTITSLREDVSDLGNTIFEATTEYNLLNNNYLNLIDKYNVMANTYNSTASAMNDMEKQATSLLQENTKLVKTINKQEKELEVFESREELYDKYEYAIEYGGKRTDLTYDDLETVESLCDKYNISPYLMTGIIMVESAGKEECTNLTSTARGFGQILAGTGKFTYENIMGNSSYNHNMALNGTTNIKMMAAYLDYLIDWRGSVTGAIYYYRGASASINEDYINRICNVTGMSRSQLGF